MCRVRFRAHNLAIFVYVEQARVGVDVYEADPCGQQHFVLVKLCQFTTIHEGWDARPEVDLQEGMVRYLVGSSLGVHKCMCGVEGRARDPSRVPAGRVCTTTMVHDQFGPMFVPVEVPPDHGV